MFDLSENDTDHEAALDLIREICAMAQMDVIGAGPVMRMEDVKKLLYAGCRQVILDYEQADTIAITEEVALKFGREKLLASYNDPALLEAHKVLLETYISGLLLMNPHQVRETQAVTDLPFYVQVNQIALNKLIEIFAYEIGRAHV